MIHAAVACAAPVCRRTSRCRMSRNPRRSAGDGNHGQEAFRRRPRPSGSAAVRLGDWDAGYEAATAVLSDAMGDEDFTAAWARVPRAYAQCGRGERNAQATAGRATLAEHKIVKLTPKDWSPRSPRGFCPPRTVQTHYPHLHQSRRHLPCPTCAEAAQHHPDCAASAGLSSNRCTRKSIWAFCALSLMFMACAPC